MEQSKKFLSKLIAVIIITFVIVIAGYKLYSIAAADIASYMTIHGDTSYLTSSEATKKDKIGKTVGYPVNSGSDYSYVTDNPRVWCLSEGQINSTGSGLKIYGIVEIGSETNPTYTKIYYDDKVEKGVKGVSERRRAQSAFTMFAGKSASKDNITAVAQKHFYDTFKSVFDKNNYLKRFKDSDIGFDNSSVQKDGYEYDTYAQEVIDLNIPMKKENYKGLTCEAKVGTNNPEKGLKLEYNTIIYRNEDKKEDDTSVFNMSTGSSLVTSREIIFTKSDNSTVTYTLKQHAESNIWYFYSGDTLKGRVSVSTGTIYLADPMEVKKVEVKINFKYIHSILYMIGGSDTQTRGVSLGEWKNGHLTSSINIANIEDESDVSMQKYIIKVNGNAVDKDKNKTELTNRENTYSSLEEEVSREKTIKHPSKTVNAVVNPANISSQYCKHQNPVHIEAGDEVTYRIYVYNNTDSVANNITIKDRIPNYYRTVENSDGTKTKYIETAVEIKSITRDGSSEDIKNTWSDEIERKDGYVNGYECIKYTISSIAAGSCTYFDITMSFNKQLNNILINTAYISGDGKSKEYRITDRDYVVMDKSYAVSLEKFVSEVNGISVTGRTGNSEADAKTKYRFNEAAIDGESCLSFEGNILNGTTEVDNLHFYKNANPVRVDAGDEVTYTIRLRNTGDNQVRITQIYDCFRFVETGKYNGLQLDFNEGYGIRGNGDGTIIDEHYGNDDKNNNKYLDRYLIRFDNPVLLNPKGEYGDSVDVTMKFTVVVSKELTAHNVILQNKSGIKGIENKNGVTVRDSDKTINNYDMDFLETNKYAISLEKFVSKVEDVQGNVIKDLGAARAGKRFNVTADADLDKNYITEKRDNKVDVEIGDYVTYTIRLQNTGDTLVKVNQIYDLFTDVQGKKLIFDTTYGVKRKINDTTYKNEPAVIKNGYKGPDGNWEEKIESVKNDSNSEHAQIYSIEFENPITLANKNDYVDLTVRFQVDVSKENSTRVNYLCNRAGIVNISNRNNITVIDSDGHSNNADMDFVETKTYAVSLEKYVSKVKDNDNKEVTYDNRAGKAEYLTDENGRYVDNTNSDSKWTQHNYHKYNNVVKVNNGNEVTYTITVKNDGNTNVKNVIVKDVLPNGVKFERIEGEGVKLLDDKDGAKQIEIASITANDSVTFNIVVMVAERNISNTIYKNTAKIDSMQNRNGIDVEDTTGNNNEDSDYIELDYEEPELIKYTAEKVWVGKEEDSDKNVRVRLYKVIDDTEILVEGKEEIITLDGKIDEYEKDPWKYTWTGLEEGDYIARELTESGNNIVKGATKYNKDTTTEYKEEGNIMTIINTVTFTPPPPPKTTKYTVIKEWIGEKEEKVTVGLYKVDNNSEVLVNNKEQELSNDNNWTFTWTGLEEGDYVAREFTKDGKSIVIGNVIYDENVTTEYIENEQGNTITIKNTYKFIDPEKTKFTVEKVWDDENNSANRPEEIEIRLYKVSEDGSETFVKGKKVTLDGQVDKNEKEPWTYTWTGLEKGTYVAREYNKDKIENGGKYDKNYSVYYLDKPEKTIITNKNDSEIEEENDDLAIAGIVWNDMALDKTASDYNGIKEVQENVLAGIKVMLHREGKGIIATTYTNANGEYSFTNESLSTNTNLGAHERYIKGPLVPNTNRWDGTYYSYKVIFEYDGITYTNTKYIAFNSKNSNLDSNAEENSITRKDFNDDFSVVSKEKFEYSTVNESGYIPQSIHKYNSSMSIQASTEWITLSNNGDLENKLKHVNLGLRGRDVFDLELTSDVYSTKVTVNRVEGTYKYNSNKVTVRREDAGNYSYLEDAANRHSTRSTYEGEAYSQSIRNTDSNVEVEADKRKTNYTETGLGIEVTYKITVQNISITEGAATKIINYYDDKYTFVKAYSGSMEMTIDNEKAKYQESGTGYKSVEIETPETKLSQTGKMEIYVVYTLDNAESILKNIDMLATFNMAEITEYKTYTTEYQNNTNNEATRGLIDKDSAPGSANSENVRLHPNLIGNISTVDYYFGGNDLSVLKYEDDTYATPTLYFVKDSNQRIITGTVFEDETGLYSNIRTGNGILDKDEEGNRKEVGIYGATVELIEQVGDGKVRYTTTTNENGDFEFKGFLPGNYIIKYWYGDTENTVIQKVFSETINGKSYNGEDFQATNNIGTHGAFELNNTENFWYVYNEDKGISTAKDNSSRREQVSKNLTEVPEKTNSETDQEYKNRIAPRLEELENIMTLLNGARDGKEVDAGDINTEKALIEQTYMYATTEPMLLTVEKTELVEVENDNGDKEIKTQERTTFGPYEITNMNFGIAEVPVTKIDLQKHVSEFTIVDSTGQNIIAGIKKGNDGWIFTGDVLETQTYDVSIEDNKLQGAKLQVKYEITSNMEVELNYDNSVGVKATISELKDIINNNLSYNSELKIDADKNNSYYWEVSNLDKSSISNIANYNTVVKATTNALNDINNGSSLYIVLEKVLSSTDSTLEDIIQSTVDIYEYNNIVEITGLSYENVIPEGEPEENPERYPQKDRIRTLARYIIIPGVQHDTATSKTITIHPPTGNNMSITYYVMAVIGLAVLAVGVFGIKKYVIKK